MIISSTMMGYLASHRLSSRVDFLRQYILFLNYIKTEVRYSAYTIYELLCRYKEESEFGSFIDECKYNIESGNYFNEAWSLCTKRLPKCNGLTNKDKELILEFGNNFGSSDVSGQIAYCDLNIDFIERTLQQAQEEKEKKSKLYLLLGLSFGISLVLFLL